MKTKKLLALILAIVMIFSLGLAGCGGGDGGSDAPAADGGGKAPAADKSEILIGYVAPFTGPLACFTVAAKWVEEKALEVINADGGIYIAAYDKKLPVRVIYGDSESNADVATKVATSLVTNDKVDILVGAWTPETTMPVSAVAERYQVPAFMSNSPADSWLGGGPYEWSFGTMFYWKKGLTDYIATMDKIDSNKKVGFVFDSEVDGILLSGYLTEMLPGAGYEIVDPGRFPISTTDYTSVITELKNADCDIVIANQVTPNFTTFWQQCHQMGYVPKMVFGGKAEHFEADISALGDIGENVLCEVLWDRTFPYESSLIDYNCDTLAQAWEDEMGTQFPMSLGYDLSIFEVLYEALSNCEDLSNTTIRDNLKAVEYEGIYGKLSFNEDNVMEVPCVTCQWIKGDKWAFEKNVTSAVTYPTITDIKDVELIPGWNTGK